MALWLNMARVSQETSGKCAGRWALAVICWVWVGLLIAPLSCQITGEVLLSNGDKNNESQPGVTQLNGFNCLVTSHENIVPLDTLELTVEQRPLLIYLVQTVKNYISLNNVHLSFDNEILTCRDTWRNCMVYGRTYNSKEISRDINNKIIAGSIMLITADVLIGQCSSTGGVAQCDANVHLFDEICFRQARHKTTGAVAPCKVLFEQTIKKLVSGIHVPDFPVKAGKHFLVGIEMATDPKVVYLDVTGRPETKPYVLLSDEAGVDLEELRSELKFQANAQVDQLELLSDFLDTPTVPETLSCKKILFYAICKALDYDCNSQLEADKIEIVRKLCIKLNTKDSVHKRSLIGSLFFDESQRLDQVVSAEMKLFGNERKLARNQHTIIHNSRALENFVRRVSDRQDNDFAYLSEQIFNLYTENSIIDLLNVMHSEKELMRLQLQTLTTQHELIFNQFTNAMREFLNEILPHLDNNFVADCFYHTLSKQHLCTNGINYLDKGRNMSVSLTRRTKKLHRVSYIFFNCLYYKPGSIFRYNHLPLARRGKNYLTGGTLIPESCLNSDHIGDIACRFLFEGQDEAVKPIQLAKQPDLRMIVDLEAKGCWVQSMKSNSMYLSNNEFVVVGFHPMFVSFDLFPLTIGNEKIHQHDIVNYQRQDHFPSFYLFKQGNTSLLHHTVGTFNRDDNLSFQDIVDDLSVLVNVSKPVKIVSGLGLTLIFVMILSITVCGICFKCRCCKGWCRNAQTGLGKNLSKRFIDEAAPLNVENVKNSGKRSSAELVSDIGTTNAKHDK